jgi:hypothetical protein
MTGPDYRTALSTAVAEYERLGEERRQIDDRLSHLAQTISALSRLLGLVATQPLGLTDACRMIYRNAGVPMSPTEVRDRMKEVGIDLSVYSNEMAAIHTVIRRLHDAGELRLVTTSPGKNVYAWQKPTRAVAIGPEIAEFVRRQEPSRRDGPPPRIRRRPKPTK